MHKTIIIILFFGVFCSCKEKEQKVDAQKKHVSKKMEETVSLNKNQVKKTDPKLSIDFITGHFNPAVDTTFIEISEKFADRQGMYMKKEAFNSFEKMWSAAQKDGVNLVIRSAARNFEYQKGIWERKWTGQTILSNGENASTVYENPEKRALKILEYSSMPGTSRHHWGTDIDFNNFNNEWFEQGEGLKLFEWLETHASTYGFCRPYTEKDNTRPDGYNEEKWHWSYMPLSKGYTEFAEKELKNINIKGFKGSDVAHSIDVVNKYILGINHSCK